MNEFWLTFDSISFVFFYVYQEGQSSAHLIITKLLKIMATILNRYNKNNSYH